MNTRAARASLFLLLPVVAFCQGGDDGADGATGGPDDAGACMADASAPEPQADPPTAAALEACLGTGPEEGPCLDQSFRGYLQSHTTMEALAVLASYEETDQRIRVDCHPIAHAIGRETFRLLGTIHESFAACDQTCHSGCYHGAIERFIRGDALECSGQPHILIEDLEAKAATACDTNVPSRYRFQCLHGLGHALMFFSGYDLLTALRACDATGDGWSRSSCYGGVFMENLVASDPTLRDVSDTDYHYPCDSLAEQYKNDCYLMQTSRMSEMGLSAEQILVECGNAGTYRYTCIQSMGRDLSNGARAGNPRGVSEICEQATGGDRDACTRGVVLALADNTWDGTYAFPYCATYAAQEDRASCFAMGSGYLRNMYEVSVEELSAECMRLVPAEPLCLDALAP